MKIGIIPARGGVVILLLLSFLDSLGAMLDGIPSTIFNEIALNYHYGDFTKGVIDIRNIVYYLSTASIFLFFTVLILEMRRWR